MAKGDPIQSPWVYDSGPDYRDKRITITVTFNNATRSITGGTIHRDAGCVYTKIVLGLGQDGTPDSSTRVFNVAGLEGDRSFNKQAFINNGFDTAEDLLTVQITAVP